MTYYRNLKRMNIDELFRYVLHILIIVYLIGVLPAYNERILAMFQSTLVKVILIILILWTAKFDMTLSLLLGIAFVVSLLTTGSLQYTPPGRFVKQVQRGGEEIGEGKIEKGVKDVITSPVQLAETMDGGEGCNSLVQPGAGCGVITGYNADYNCVCDANALSCQCQGLQTQNLGNAVMGYPGDAMAKY